MQESFGFYFTSIFTIVTAVCLAGKITHMAMKKSSPNYNKTNMFFNLCHEFYFVFLIAWILRSFLFQPYKVPTGSLEPTILPGDFILVKQFAYGINFPFPAKQLIRLHNPKRGDIVLLHYPKNEKIIYVKRIIGLPGDTIKYENKHLFINDNEIPEKFITMARNDDGSRIIKKTSTLPGGFQHNIQITLGKISYSQPEIVIPAGKYFVMGDNRDNSQDSRYFGLVDSKKIVGQAKYIWLSIDPTQLPSNGMLSSIGNIATKIRTERIGRKIG